MNLFKHNLVTNRLEAIFKYLVGLKELQESAHTGDAAEFLADATDQKLAEICGQEDNLRAKLDTDLIELDCELVAVDGGEALDCGFLVELLGEGVVHVETTPPAGWKSKRPAAC